MTYIFPKLSRFNLLAFRVAGPGLGNLLYPWARAEVCARNFGLPIINPTWFQFKLGPFLRGEKDKRTYVNLFSPADGYITGVSKLASLAVARWVSEMEFAHNPGVWTKRRDNIVVTYEGLGRYFADILSDHEYVFRRLLSIARDAHKSGLAFNFANSISVHVRLADFKVLNQVTRFDFFKETITALRRALGSLKLWIFTDGAATEVSEFISLGDAEVVTFGSSLADLLALARSNILVASGNSTFGWWASYLGRMPVIWPRATTTSAIYYERPDRELFFEAGGTIPQRFINEVTIANLR